MLKREVAKVKETSINYDITIERYERERRKSQEEYEKATKELNERKQIKKRNQEYFERYKAGAKKNVKRKGKVR